MTGMEPGGFYWAVEKHEDTRATIVHVSTVWGGSGILDASGDRIGTASYAGRIRHNIENRM
jgi:hypothetical protein